MPANIDSDTVTAAIAAANRSTVPTVPMAVTF
jgi:hypothetical protein